MKNFTILLLILIFNNFHSQVTSIEYIVEKAELKQKFILDINGQNSFFYSNEYCGNQSEEIYNYVIVENTIQDKNFLFHDQLETLKVYYKQKINLIWKLTKEEKKVENIKLYKATTIYKNKEWIAWYNPEIPLNYGPFIFSNLPGLIYEVSCDNLRISLSSIENKNKNCIIISKKEKPIDKESYEKYNSDLLKILKEGYRKNTNIIDNISLQSIFDNSLKKDLLREYL